MHYKFSILIAEDDEDDIFILKKTFGEIYPELIVNVVHNGEQVLKFLQDSVENSKDLPRFIITDLNMPLLDGFEVIKRVRNDRRYVDVPVYVYSTCTQPMSKVKCILMGAMDYFSKSSTTTELEEILKKILSRENFF